MGKNGFLNRIKGYHELRNKPAGKALSNLSPYYHFGQLSCQQAAIEVAKLKSKHKVRTSAVQSPVCNTSHINVAKYEKSI